MEHKKVESSFSFINAVVIVYYRENVIVSIFRRYLLLVSKEEAVESQTWNIGIVLFDYAKSNSSYKELIG